MIYLSHSFEVSINHDGPPIILHVRDAGLGDVHRDPVFAGSKIEGKGDSLDEILGWMDITNDELKVGSRYDDPYGSPSRYFQSEVSPLDRVVQTIGVDRVEHVRHDLALNRAWRPPR